MDKGSTPIGMPVRRDRRRRAIPGQPNPTRTTLFLGQSQREKDRLAKRAERDLRACRMNYAGWCGYEESGTAV